MKVLVKKAKGKRQIELLDYPKKVDVNALITKVLPMKDWETGFNLAKSGEAIKVLLKPGDI